MERKIEFAVDEYYHVYNRGVEKRKIFLLPKDYQRFLWLLYLANTTESIHLSNLLYSYQGFPLIKIFSHPKKDNLVAIGAFCLMPNHFHLLLKEITEGGISRFMLKLQTAYSMYFNTKNERSGALWQGIFRAEHVDEDQYLKYLFSYIHLNPAKLVNANWRNEVLSTNSTNYLHDYLAGYPYSSYRIYLSVSENNKLFPEHAILQRKSFPKYFTPGEEIKEEMAEWLSYIKGSP